MSVDNALSSFPSLLSSSKSTRSSFAATLVCGVIDRYEVAIHIILYDIKHVIILWYIIHPV